MHHQRLMPRAVFADVLEIEARRQIEIELHGGELPGPADRVNQLDVDLRSVECRFALDALEGNLQPVERGFQRAGCTIPVFRMPA